MTEADAMLGKEQCQKSYHPAFAGRGAIEVLDNGKGVVYQKPGSVGNSEPASRYPNGYVRIFSKSGPPVTLMALREALLARTIR